jgi:hypothetical protein
VSVLAAGGGPASAGWASRSSGAIRAGRDLPHPPLRSDPTTSGSYPARDCFRVFNEKKFDHLDHLAAACEEGGVIRSKPERLIKHRLTRALYLSLPRRSLTRSHGSRAKNDVPSRACRPCGCGMSPKTRGIRQAPEHPSSADGAAGLMAPHTGWSS